MSRTKEELIIDAEKAIEAEDIDGVCKCLHETLLHLSFFSWIVGDDTWDDDMLCDTCHRIGDMIYDKFGFTKMQEVWYMIDDKMSDSGSGPLARYWDGCGNGAWIA